VHSSGLIDGMLEPHVRGVGAVAAHVAIGFTGQHHRHSGVVRAWRPQARYRASRFPGLYHSSAACADLLSSLRRQLAVDGAVVVHEFARLSRCSFAAFDASMSCADASGSPT